MIHIVTGPPCAGKSTYVREHAKDGDLRVDYDLIAQALGSANSHAAEGLIRDAAFGAREGAIAEALKNTDADSWIIHTSPNEEHMKSYTDAGADFVNLDPGYDVCIERAKTDGRPQQTFDGIEKWYSGKKGRTAKMNYKSISVQYKDEGNGSIEGYASTWVREPDSYGDVCRKGCFENSLKTRWNGGMNIPLLFAHKMDDLNAYIGTARAKEDDYGLHFHADFDGSPEAEKVRSLYKSGSLNSFSFAYDVIDSGVVTLEDGRKANELRELDIFEISCVLVPANPTSVVTDIKAGRRNSKKDADAIRQAITLLQSVLDAEEDQDGEDGAKANGAPEELKQSNPKRTDLLEYIENIWKGEEKDESQD